jgi:hypothetical protein
MAKLKFVVVAFVVGSVLGGAFGSMGGHHLIQGLAIGGAAGITVAWLVLFREANA